MPKAARRKPAKNAALEERDQALRFQAATADILASLARSRESPQPVFDAIVRNVRRLFDTRYAVVFLIKGDQLELGAVDGDPRFMAPGSEATQRFLKSFPQPLDWTTFTGQAMKAGEVRQLVPIIGNPQASPRAVQLATTFGYNSMVTAPLVLDGRVVGTIGTNHSEARRYSEREFAALKAFADQAVIAIENARLFNETKEALERQTATADILRVIAGSPGDLQPVLDALAETAARLCGANDVIIRRVDGDQLRMAAHFGSLPITVESHACTRETVAGRAVLERRTVHVEDILSPEGRAEYPDAPAVRRPATFHTILAVPLLRQDAAIGVMILRRLEKRLFSDQAVTLLEAFAAQAVIAIENARLFNETKEALERQTATSEILKVISSSTMDTQPVFEAIVRSAARLFPMCNASIFMRDGELMRLHAVEGATVDDAVRRELASIYPIRFDPQVSTSARAMVERQINICLDTEAPEVAEHIRRAGRAGRFRSNTVVPLVRDDAGIGTIVITHPQPGYRLNEKQLELLRTFADQAVIAIENTRLFNETKESLDQQTATAEILKVISRSQTDVQPVLEAIVNSAAQLFAPCNAFILMRDGPWVRLHAMAGATIDEQAREKVARFYPVPFDPELSTSARAMVERRMNACPDTEAPGVAAYIRDAARAGRFRANTVVPLVRDDEGIGTLVVTYPEPGHVLNEKQLALLRTFADQAVIAIENTRLFNETKEALDQQKASAEVLGAISGSIADTQPVFEKILASSERLFAGERVGITLAEGDTVRLAAYRGPQSEPLSRIYPLPLSRESGTGWAILNAAIAHFPDIEAPAVPPGVVAGCRTLKVRAIVFAPMVFEGKGIGAIWVARSQPGPFSDKQISQLRSFADQAVIAIHNARLFKEIEEKSAQLEVANRHKSEFLANMSHELRTPLNAVIGFSEVLLERMFGELNDKQADYLKDIHESGRHLLSLINDILDLSKIEAGRMELELSSFSLPAAISNAMTLVRERAQRHGVQLGAQIDPRLGEVRADERKVKQILLNLLSNAVKFTPEGGRVDVSAKLDTDRVQVAVKDTGVGISADDQAKLFEEFRQVGADAARKAEGTGLGLALARKFVELHGGAIRVESAPGKGATFSFSLPLAAAARSASSG